MEPKTSIKQHDFISGEPRHKYFVFSDHAFNPLRFIPTDVGGGFNQGELSVITAPAGVGKTNMMSRILESMGDNRQIATFDYMSLYPEVQRLHHIVPEGHIVTENNTNPNREIVDRLLARARELRIDQEERERINQMSENERFAHKITLNSFY
jgi:hypothetical protein